MFARKVATHLKPNSLTEFTNLMEHEILPWLRKQEGFLDLITLAVPDGREVATISFWDHQGNAEAYNSSGYPEVLKILGKLLDGTPYVKTFDVVGSTFQRVALARPPEAENLVQETDSAQPGYRSYETTSDGNLVSSKRVADPGRAAPYPR
jgi:heme-degrading monooxygenase HmoA